MEGELVRQAGVAALGVCAACAAPASVAVHAPATREVAWDRGGLHVSGAPPLPDALVRQADRYEAIATARVYDFDTRRGLLANVGGDLAIVRAPGAAPETLVDEGGIAWAAFYGDAVAYAADRGGDEDTALYRWSRVDPAWPLVGARTRVVDPVVGDDGTLAWAATQPVDARGELWIGVDPTPALVARDDARWTPLALRGGTLLARRATSEHASAIYVARGAAAPVAITTEEGAVAAALGADGAVYVVSRGGGSDRARLYELGTLGRRTAIAPELAGDVTELAVAADGALVAFVVEDAAGDGDGGSRLYLYDPATREVRAAAGAPSGGAISELRFARDAPVVALDFTSATQPRAAYTYDPRSAQLVRWTTAAAPPAVVAPTREHAESFDGTPIALTVYRPHGVAQAPVVVELHGGPEDRFAPRWNPRAQLLVARGFAVVQPDVRGSAGYGEKFAALDDGPRRADAVRDVGAVLDWVARQPGLDAGRVALVGESYGGYLALAAALAHPARVRAVVDLWGIADFVAFLEHTARWRVDERRAEYGDERDPAARAQLAALSPLAHAADLHVPLLVAHGRRDPRVPFGDSERLARAVPGAWLAAADDEGHGFAATDARVTLDALVVAFLHRYLFSTTIKQFESGSSTATSRSSVNSTLPASPSR